MRHMKNIVKICSVVFMSLFLLSTAKSQIKFDDPLTVIKSPEGKVLSKDDIKQIMDSGKKFSMFQTEKGDSTVYHLRYLSDEENAKTKTLRTNVIEGLKGKPIKPFSLKTLNDKLISDSSIKGKVTVLNFWFTGCKPCIREMPELNELVEKYGESVNFLAPTFDSAERVEAFMKKREFKYVSLPNSKSLNESLGINVYPTHLIVDKKGIVRNVIFGANEDIGSQLDDAIKNILQLDK